MSNHTPGPWGFDGGAHIPGGSHKIAAVHIRAAPGRPSYEWCSGTIYAKTESLTQTEDKANAYLIKAAPDMLAALEDLDRFLWKEGYSTSNPEVANLLKIVAQAKGESDE